MIPLPFAPKVIEKKGNKAIFEIEALAPGYGVTVGNALRRVILSSLPGAAITRIKIKGVQHEFSTLPGVLEDVINIVLNLKQLRFKIFSDEPQMINLKVKGEKDVKGSDFDLPSQVELANPEAHIVTLTDKKAEFEMEAQVEKGLGYLPVEKRKAEKLEIGQLPIDAIFTPIKKVSINVENMRVGDRTDFDKLNIEIETDGTISSEEAFTQSADILVKHFSLMEEAFKVEPKKMSEAKIKTETQGKKITEEDVLKMKVDDLKISKRTLNALHDNGIATVGKIIKKTEKSLLELDGMGEKAVQEIKRALKKLKLELKG